MNKERYPTIIFLHIPKTAGSSLRTIVYRQYSNETVFQFYDPLDNHRKSRDELVERLKTGKPPLRLIIGHMGFGIHKYLDGPFSYFTMLRDPIERTISTYYYIRHYSSHPLNAQARCQSLDEFVGSYETIDNNMTRFLSQVKLQSQLSQQQIIPPGQCTREMLDCAKQNLKQYFKVVGLVERFDESLLLFKQAFGWHNIFYKKMNVNKKRLQRQNIPAATLHKIERANELDLELYQYSKSMFDTQIESQKLDFKVRLHTFKVLNQNYQIYYPFQQQIRKLRPVVLPSHKS